MAVQAHRVELGDDEDPVQTGMNAVGYGDVDEPVLAGDGHGRLGPALRQGKEPRAAAAAEDDRQAIVHA